MDLVNSVGLADYTRERARMFVMFVARKPALQGQPAAAASR